MAPDSDALYAFTPTFAAALQDGDLRSSSV
jgi:hypothetical protein